MLRLLTAVALLWALTIGVPNAFGAAPKENGKPKEPGAAAEPKPDPFNVPEGSAEDLLAYIEGLREQRPEGRTREAFIEFQKKLQGAVAEAASRILLAKPNEEQQDAALQYLNMSVSMLGRLGVEEPAKRLGELQEKLSKAGKPALARELRGMVLGNQLQTAAGQGREELTKAIAEVKTYLAEGVTADNARLAMMAGQAAEYGDHIDLAIETYKDMSKLLAASKDEGVARLARLLAGVVRRLELPGNEMKVEGKLLSGAAFDWSKYRGQVVLVDFWATWCGPCRAEIPHLKELYEEYHKRGFEVIGVSLDRSKEPLEEFVKDAELPWPIIYNDDGPSPTVEYYGIFAIPTTVLVGRDGKVITLEARGERLDQQLTKLIGPPEEKKPPKDEPKKNNK